MPLQAPVLDDRTFEQIVEEAKARIPRYTPEWTNFNTSDPGFTLVQLHAWLTETILYRLNKLPDLNYIKFLDLLNVQPHPALAAQAQLSFKLKKLSGVNDPLVVLIPKSTQVGVDDPDLEEELLFETDRTLTALNGALAAIITPANTVTTSRELLTEYDAKTAETQLKGAFYPFGKDPEGGEVCLLGIVLRPHRQKGKDYSLDRFPEGELDLTVLIPQVFEEDAEGDLITGPSGIHCLFPWQAQEQSKGIVWEAYHGVEHTSSFTDNSAWVTLNVFDETAALTRSGHVYLNVPGACPQVAFSALSRTFWESIDLKKPPSTRSELINDITTRVFAPTDLDEDAWKAMGLSGDDLSDLLDLIGDPDTELSDITSELATLTLDPSKVDEEVWTDLGYDAQPVPYGVTWFRARLTGEPEKSPVVRQFLLNTVAATAAVTRVEEIIGNSDGRPNQTHSLSRTPILVDESTGKPALTLEIVSQNQSEAWTAVSDFYGAGPANPVFLLDSESGTLTFGDGVHGRIPVAGAQIIAREYRYGGGAVGNAGAATITALKSALPDVDSVTNVRPAAGGADAETLDEVKLRAPHDLRTRERAVTAEDFAELALQTPSVRLQRAYALARTSADLSVEPPTLTPNQDGAVTVVILPENDEDTPQPTEDQLRLVCSHLNARRLITTELFVVGPRYLELKKFEVEVTASRDVDLKALHEAIMKQLTTYFHPLRGGEDGRGWPFGHDIFFGNVYRQVLSITGVLRVLCLEITPAEDDEKCDDVITVPDGTLIYLPQDIINVKVSYDPYG
ncbi:MAG: putative baseplate assembly protein [Anaerolineae bacterium]